MSVIGDFTVPAPAFALGEALAAVPDAVVEADHVATHSRLGVLPFIWVSGDGADAFADALADDQTVESFVVADEFADEVLYHVQWTETVAEVVDSLVDHHAAITHARAREDAWTFRMRFAEESMVSSFKAFLDERDVAFEVHSLSKPSGPRQGETGLTPEQRAALEAAYHSGYFAIPRETSSAELGERLDISGNAASERVRRGCEALIESSLPVEDDRR